MAQAEQKSNAAGEFLNFGSWNLVSVVTFIDRPCFIIGGATKHCLIILKLKFEN